MATWVYVLYGNNRMILAEVIAEDLRDADKIVSAFLGEKLEKRPDIGVYASHWSPRQHIEDMLQFICSH